jgi:hypothetical protein
VLDELFERGERGAQQQQVRRHHHDQRRNQDDRLDELDRRVNRDRSKQQDERGHHKHAGVDGEDTPEKRQLRKPHSEPSHHLIKHHA